jgi:hypothetical protein
VHHLFHRPTHAVSVVLATVGAAVFTVAGVLLGYEAGAVYSSRLVGWGFAHHSQPEGSAIGPAKFSASSQKPQVGC